MVRAGNAPSSVPVFSRGVTAWRPGLKRLRLDTDKGLSIIPQALGNATDKRHKPGFALPQ